MRSLNFLSVSSDTGPASVSSLISLSVAENPVLKEATTHARRNGPTMYFHQPEKDKSQPAKPRLTNPVIIGTCLLLISVAPAARTSQDRAFSGSISRPSSAASYLVMSASDIARMSAARTSYAGDCGYFSAYSLARSGCSVSSERLVVASSSASYSARASAVEKAARCPALITPQRS